MAGTQGADGKSRVLFYLGSFDSRNGKTPTLEGDSVEGHLTDERCDYYIDRNGNAWMRIGVEDKDGVGVPGNANGNAGNANWKETEKVGFLQANAITADMINAGSITADKIAANAITADKIATNAITADKIDVSTISIESLNTKPEKDSDSIQISDNYIHCLNSNGKKNLIISSDNLNNAKVEQILKNTDFESSEAVPNDRMIDIEMVRDDIMGCLTNLDVWFSSTIPHDIGYIFAGSSLHAVISLLAFDIPSNKWNSLIYQGGILAGNWNIIAGINATPYIVGGGGTDTFDTLSGITLLIYKKNKDGEWEEYTQRRLRGTWIDTNNVWNKSGYSGQKRYKFLYDFNSLNSNRITINDDGEYGLRFGIEYNAITMPSDTTTIIKSLSGFTKYSIEQKKPDTYTEIGKDGIIVYDGINVMKLNSDGVEMKSKKEESSADFFGWKVTSGGIYYCNGGSSWTQWNP